MDKERPFSLGFLAANSQQVEVVNQAGAELFWEAAEILKRFGSEDRVVVAPNLRTMRGNRSYRILSTPLVPQEAEGPQSAFYRLSIRPALRFGSALKPALAVTSLVRQQDSEPLEQAPTGSYFFSEQGEVIKSDGQSCRQDEIEQARNALGHIKSSLERSIF
jgi:hypothetical protein